MIFTSGSDAVSFAPGAVMPKLTATAESKGRPRTSKEQRRVILAEFERSGISTAAFAERIGLKYESVNVLKTVHRMLTARGRNPAKVEKAF